jgi:hypothetical protein
LGIASCVTALLAILAGGFAMVLTAKVGFDNMEAAIDDEEPAALIACVFFLGAGLLSLIGGVLAIAGVAQSDRNKVFAVIGLCLNALMFFCGFALMALGALAD